VGARPTPTSLIFKIKNIIIMLGKVLSLYKIGAKKIITAYQNLSDIGIYFGHSDRFHTKGDGKPY